MSFVIPKGLGALGLDGYRAGLGMVEPPKMGSLFGNGLVDHVPPPPTQNGLGMLLSPVSPSDFLGPAMNVLLEPQPFDRTKASDNALLTPNIKRKAYFAFRFEDIMRVNNVRRAWLIKHPNSPQMRSFYDRSIWDKSVAKHPDALKRLMTEAMTHSSAVCVLVGTNTWQGRWVKYEIARSVVDGRGLLSVHINGLNHIERKSPDPRGHNPLHFMGVFHAQNGNFYLYEHIFQIDPNTSQLSGIWVPYQDFKNSVPLPKYIPSIPVGQVMPLARYTKEYDFVLGVGDSNVGAWIDQAAAEAGR